ncbi:MAG: hypothetical protein MUF81_19005 [Verrucomicrobia bacterium]|nr:hypothetical protein [Verrucomicrobiota bacterium]
MHNWAGPACGQFTFAGGAAFLYVARVMFETIHTRIEAVEQKLKHLRRFL